jgi:hypothetical protein
VVAATPGRIDALLAALVQEALAADRAPAESPPR